jgi:hypothetical protein
MSLVKESSGPMPLEELPVDSIAALKRVDRRASFNAPLCSGHCTTQ